MQTKADIVREYRTKFPDKPTKALARLVYKKKANKLLWKDEEAVRSSLRYIEGKQGEKARKEAKEKAEFFIQEARPYNPYKLPDSDETDYSPFVVHGKRIGVINDVHVPYHSISALTVAISFLKRSKIDVLICNGDFWDFHGLSRFIKDPRKRRFASEIQVGIQLLELLQKELKCKIIFKPGNHDDRLLHYLWQKMGEIDELADLEEIKELSLESIVRKRSPNLDIEFVKSKQIIRVNDLNIVHGHEFASSIMSPVSIARGLYLRAKASSLCGHHHRTSEHTENSIESKIVTTWSVGCLCELHPEYMPINNWNHGFALIEVNEENQTFHVVNKRIYGNTVL